PFGPKTGVMRQYLSAGSGKSLYFAFAPEDVNWQSETVTAHFLSPNGGWDKRVVPFPDVIYNRVTSRSLERSLPMMTLKERFSRKKIPIFNWSFYDKWKIYHILQGEPDAAKHVPESYLDPTHE